ncbi:MAG TPA: type I restriction endonuclease subunit R, partial [Agitococcus sp.]|nr:type I restriction endonuclease subunit R [Agitococcus sp.]
SEFYSHFMAIFKDSQQRENPESYLNLTNSIRKYIEAHPKHSADTKAKSAQYFTILNAIEYVISLDDKFKEPSFLYFWQKINTVYNTLHQDSEHKDPIEVYFDNQIGIIEVTPHETEEKKKKQRQLAKAKESQSPTPYQFDILSIIEARNEQSEKVAALIEDFQEKIKTFFDYIRTQSEGERLIIKIKSRSSENEIYDLFAIIYRRYSILKKREVGEYFFKETKDLVNKLCDDFEKSVLEETNASQG